MNWDSINASAKTKGILLHWQKLGNFRNSHPTVGAGRHKKISDIPHVFSRVYTKGDFTDTVVIGLDLPKGKKEIKVSSVFKEGMELHEAYSNTSVKVENGKVIMNSNYTIVLLEPLKM